MSIDDKFVKDNSAVKEIMDINSGLKQEFEFPLPKEVMRLRNNRNVSP